ncbi:MAG: dTDP-glucose 4,6-dehydratase [Candidatus Omnitrophica bacterium]|nr:dTDP-glucose 4,6-dehydratase [Candidatus Omnitrophota bacterium]
METILVTGGYGFIGSNFIRYMFKKYKHIKIINLDKLTYAGNLNNLADIDNDKRYKFIKGDICDAKLLDNILSAADHKFFTIVNFAAETHVDRSIKNASDFVRTNIEGVRTLLESCRKHKIKKILHISTDEVYGDVQKGFSKEGGALLPNSPYAASKAAADLLCLAYCHTYKMPVTITRSSNNYGPYQYPEKVMPLFITNLLEKKKLPLYGDGKNIREWIYVEDNCSAIDCVLKKGLSGEIYNIGSASLVKNLDMANAVLKRFKLKSNFIEYVTDRPGHDRRYALNSGKIRKLGWRPQYNFEKALNMTIGWYKHNKWWWQPLKQKANIIKW